MSNSCVDEYPIKVKIFKGDKLLVEVPQRDLFSKYNWPAKDKIIDAVKNTAS